MDIRTLVLGLGVFCATFLVGWWLNIGGLFYGTGASQAQPAAAAAEGPVTSGQGQTQGQTTQRFVAHVPVSTGPQSSTAQPKAPSARLPQVKYAQEPKAKTATVSKPGMRIRIRRR